MNKDSCYKGVLLKSQGGFFRISFSYNFASNVKLIRNPTFIIIGAGKQEEIFDWSGKTIRPFCTHEDSGLSQTECKIQDVCKGAAVTSGPAIQGGLVDHARTIVEKWV